MVNRKELAAIVDTMVSAWQVEITDRKSLYRTWFRYLSDVPFDAGLAALDARVVAGDRWAPRVGELRRAALDRVNGAVDWIDNETAWQHAEWLLQSANSGISTTTRRYDPEVEAAVSRAMKRAGTRDGFHKQAFIKAFEIETAEFEQRRYGLPAEAPTVIVDDE
jgi:hypothetical protein